MQMNTQTNAPMVRIPIHRRRMVAARRRSVDDALELARLEHADWWWMLELHSNVSIAGAVDLEVSAKLIETAPTDFLAGYVAGLVVNN